MNRLQALFRPELHSLRPYRAAEYADGYLRLNANETPWRPTGDESSSGLNRYPEVRPTTLTARLAAHYGVDPDRLLVTRGSSEGIELLIRATCRTGLDDIVICPPTFGMYSAYAQVQGAGIVEVPLLRDQGFALDIPGIERAWSDRSKLLFLCSPNNPTGNSVPAAQIAALCEQLDGRGLVIVDGAYLEFAAQDSSRDLLDRCPNLVLLRTLSKALGLAGVRCGAALADPSVIDMLSRVLPPYSLSTPCTDAVLAALDEAAARQDDIDQLIAERQRVAAALANSPRVERVWPSDANFLLVQARDADALLSDARNAGVLIRDFSQNSYTPGCVRITISTRADNDRLLEAIAGP
jgi:histidinol-phosphate aminotransferase